VGDVDSGRWTSSIMNEEGIKKGCIVLCTTGNLVMMDEHHIFWMKKDDHEWISFIKMK
jgi:hypothetical protein